MIDLHLPRFTFLGVRDWLTTLVGVIVLCSNALTPNLVADEPIATLAVISNPYITTLPPELIADETGRDRSFLAQTGPPSMQKVVALVNQLKPDALVALGSLTWSGSDDDLTAFRSYLDQVEVPIYVTPGHRDQIPGSLDGYQRILGEHDVSNQVRSINGVSLVFESGLHTDPDASSERIETQLRDRGNSKGTLLFVDRDRNTARSKLTPDHKRFWNQVNQHDIAVRFEPSRYGHRVSYENTLPVWTVGSTAWSTRGSISFVQVFHDRIEIAEVSDPTQLTFSLTVPNPVAADRMVLASDDPYQCPSYSEDLLDQPDFTFALVSDPQFDREASRDHLIRTAEAAIDDLNRLDPAMVFITGDLVNNNLPEEWELFQRTFAKLQPPWHVAPGNHDVLFNYEFVEASYASAATQKPEYAATVAKALLSAEEEGFSGPTALFEKYTGAQPRQLIQHDACAFITVPFLTTRADSEQIEYLRQQLECLEEKDHVFVLAHYPSLAAFGNNIQPGLGGSEVLSLLHQHRVTGYLFGHRHRNGFRMHDRTAHVLSDNMATIHLLHVFPDRVVIGRKQVGSPLYEKLVVPSPRK